MAERSIAVTLRANVTDFRRQIGAAATDLDNLAKKAGQPGASQTFMGRMVQSAQLQREAWSTAGTALAGFGAAAVGAFGLATKAAVDWESAFAGVMKTVDETASTTYADIEESLRGMARELPATHQEIAAVAEAAGQLGVATEDVAEFSETMIALGESTNLTADEAATMIAQMSNVMGTMARDGAEGVERLGSTLVQLGNNSATTERDILAMSQRISSTASVIGMTEADVLGFATALSSVGINAEAGGSAISRVFMSIASSVSQGGEDLESFAEIAGTSASEFARSFEEDPARAVATFIDGLGRISAAGGDVFGVLSDLGMSDIRVSQALLTMAESGDLLFEALDMGAEAWEENTALQDEFAKRLETTQAQLDIAKNNIVDAGISLGTTFLPAITTASGAVADFFGWISDLPSGVQGVIGTMGALAGATSLAGGAFLFTFPRVLDTVTALRDLGAISPEATRRMGRLAGTMGRFAGKAGIIGAIAVSLGAVANALHDRGAVKNAGDIAAEIERITDAGRRLDTLYLPGIFEEMPSFMGVATIEAKSLGEAMEQLVNPSVTDKISQFFGRVGLPSYMDDTAEAVAATDEAMAAMVNSDNVEEIARQLEGMGHSAETVAELMPETTARIEAQRQIAEGAVPATEDLAGAQGELATATGELDPALEEAAEELQKWLDMVRGADASFIDLLGAYQAVIDKNREVAQSTADTTGASKAAWEDYYDGVSFAIDDFIAELERQVEAQQRWEENILLLSGRVSEGFLSDLIALEEEGAPLVAGLVDATDEELARMEELWSQRADNVTDAFAQTLMDSAPVMAAAAHQLGEDAVAEIAAKLATGETTLNQVIEDYNLVGIEVDADTGKVITKIDELPEYAAGTEAEVSVSADPTNARVAIGDFLVEVRGTTGVVTIDGSPMAGLQTLDEFLAAVGTSSEEVTINGNPANGEVQLVNFIQAIANSEEDVTIAGDNQKGREALQNLVHAINRASGTVKVHADTSAAAETLNRFVGSWNGRRITTYQETVILGQGRAAVGGPVGAAYHFASGGPVFGPGTGTSDSVPAVGPKGVAYRLSNGEHILTAAEVAAVGGHSAVYALRAAMRSGQIRSALGYAAGGEVPRYAPSPQVVYQPAPVAAAPSLVGVRIQGRLDLGDGLTGVIDGRIVERERQLEAF